MTPNAPSSQVPLDPKTPAQVAAQLLNLSNIYVLHYVAGNTPKLMQKNFTHNGPLSTAINRARLHCEKMRIRFITVKPFLMSLDDEEKALEVRGD